MNRGSVPETALSAHLAGRGVAEVEGESKLVTILFADVVGSTAMAADLEPEDMVDILNGLFVHWVAAVHRYEGIVDKFLGDGMLALFGAPVVHEDDPRRAVLAALEIRDATHAYAATLEGMPLDARVGLNTGTVVVGTVGSDARLEYTAIGDAVNVAQRIESSAQPGSVFIGEATRTFVEPHFALRPAGDFRLKGKPEAVSLYEVAGDLAVPGTARGVEGLTSPLVGREAELGRVADVLVGVQGGKGAVVGLVGDPGLGKSRLLAEVRRRATGLAWAEGHALSFGAATPFLPLGQIVEELDGAPTDPDLAALVAAGASVDTEGLRDRLMSAVRRLIVERAPVVLVVEDLHWVDEASLDMLSVLAAAAAEHPICLLITARPEGRSRLAALGAEILAIDRLDHSHHVELVHNLLGIDRIPAALRDLVLERSQGNPLFTEEFLRMIIDEEVITRSEDGWAGTGAIERLAVPTTLQGLVASRIDRLDLHSKRTLQAASVLGPVFSELLLARLVGHDVDLDRLHGGGFLLPGPEPATHAFKHVITQEVAYSGLLKKRRRVLHRQAGEAIEEWFPAETELRASELGRHFDLAGEADRAVAYLLVAARRSFAAFSNEAALTTAARALELTVDSATRFDLLELRAKVLGHVGRHAEEGETVQELESLAGEDDRLRLRMLEAAVRCRLRSDYLEAYPLCGQALELSEHVDDPPQRARLLLLWGSLQRRQYSPPRAIEALREAVEIFTAEGITHSRAAALGELAEVTLVVDESSASELIQEALDAARQAGNPQLLAGALVRSAVHRMSTDPNGALADLDQGIAIAREIGDSAAEMNGHRLAGYAHVSAGNSDVADVEFLKAMDIGRQAGDAHGWLMAAMGMVETWEAQERFGDLVGWLGAVEPEMAAWGHRHNRAYVHYALGYRALRWLHQLDAALHHLDVSAHFVEGSPDWRPPAVMFRNGRAAVLLDLGRAAESAALVKEARAIAAEHQLEEVTAAYLLVTEARISLQEGRLDQAREAVDSLAEYADAVSAVGERHAADVLAGELAMCENRFEEAEAAARRALDAEPLRATTRWFSRLQVLDLMARATAAAGGDASPVWRRAGEELDDFLSSLAEEFGASARLRPDIARILAVGEERARNSPRR